LEFGIKTHRFPVFNIADSSVSVGVAIFIFYIIFISESKKPAAGEGTNAPGTL